MLKTINLEDGMPTREEALENLRFYLLYGEGRSGGVIRIVHGFGSSGKGGVIRKAVREYLQEEKAAGAVKAVVYGEQFTSLDKTAVALKNECYELMSDLDRYNRGITIIKV